MLKKLFKKDKTALLHIIAPVSGHCLDLEDVPDPVFSGKLMGEGVAIQPDLAKTTIVSPIKGRIIMLADTHHAIGIQDKNGLELLIHIGLDTVELKGKGFKPLVSVNEEVELGQPLMEVDLNLIKLSGKNTIIPVVITNQANTQYKMVKNQSRFVETGKTILFSMEKNNG